MLKCTIGLEPLLGIILLSLLEHSTTQQSTAPSSTGSLRALCAHHGQPTTAPTSCSGFATKLFAQGLAGRGSEHNERRATPHSLREHATPKGAPRLQRAMPWRHVRSSEQAQETSSQTKKMMGKSPVGDTSLVTLIKTSTTLHHSQKAGKV